MGGPATSSDPEQAATAPNAVNALMSGANREYLCKNGVRWTGAVGEYARLEPLAWSASTPPNEPNVPAPLVNEDVEARYLPARVALKLHRAGEPHRPAEVVPPELR